MKNPKGPVRTGLGEAYRSIAPYASAGWVLVVSITVCMVLGWKLDKKINTLPLFTITGSMLGIGLGLYNVMIVLKGSVKKTKNEL
jgi:F0F1-type ATP synthase assembly protein I